MGYNKDVEAWTQDVKRLSFLEVIIIRLSCNMLQRYINDLWVIHSTVVAK
jgi:hypothetical protein